jgi:sugar phosphate isomerase/epimerase
MNQDMSRRNFLRTGATAATALSSGGARSLVAQEHPKETTDSPGKLGVASYTFRNFSRAEMIGYMKQLNLNGLNAKDVKDHLPMDPAQETAALADYKVAGVSLHAVGTIYFPKDDDDDIRTKFEYCKRAGANVIVAGDPTADMLPRIEKFVKEYDIRLAIHNHGPEDKIWHSPLDILKVVHTMDPRIGCCIDVGHTMRAGVDPVQAIHAVGPRLFNVHMKDLANATQKESQVAVGEGVMPIRGIFEALNATRYKGFVDLEYEIHADDPMPGVSLSFAYMRGVLAGMRYKDLNA